MRCKPRNCESPLRDGSIHPCQQTRPCTDGCTTSTTHSELVRTRRVSVMPGVSSLPRVIGSCLDAQKPRCGSLCGFRSLLSPARRLCLRFERDVPEKTPPMRRSCRLSRWVNVGAGGSVRRRHVCFRRDLGSHRTGQKWPQQKWMLPAGVGVQEGIGFAAKDVRE